MPQVDDDTACDDCGASFPLRQDSGLCSKCSKLAKMKHGSPEYNDTIQWPQCRMCGVTRRNMRPSLNGQEQTCGSTQCSALIGGGNDPEQISSSKALHASSTVNTVPETYQVRAAATRDRLKVSALERNAGPGTSHTTASLLSHEHGGGAPGEAKYFVAWQVRNSKHPTKIDADLGGHTKRWAASVFLTDIKADVVKTLNVHWAVNQDPLLPEHVSFRWSGNKLLDPDTSTLRLGDFYDYYNTPAKAPIYLSEIPTAFKHLKKNKTPALCFEVYIDYNAWKHFTSLDEDADMSEKENDTADGVLQAAVRGLSRKRTRALSSAAISQSRSVRPRQNQSSGPSHIHRQSAVVLKKFVCMADKATGVCKLIDADKTISGNVLATPFSSGAMKEAFDLNTAEGEQLVAKRFVKLTNDDTDTDSVSVSVDDNRVEVEAELIRLTQGKWFLENFYKFCRSKPAIAVDQNIGFADAFLAQETGSFSIASGLQDSFELRADRVGITWLVEHKRPTTVIKYSGTLSHRPRQKDMRSLSIQAFVHFVFGYSKQTLVFADLQGSPAQVKGRDGLILFDVMTHTIEGNSGVGDFGEAGIKTFLDQHRCNDLCIALGLDKSMPLVYGNTDLEDGEVPNDDDTN